MLRRGGQTAAIRKCGARGQDRNRGADIRGHDAPGPETFIKKIRIIKLSSSIKLSNKRI